MITNKYLKNTNYFLSINLHNKYKTKKQYVVFLMFLLTITNTFAQDYHIADKFLMPTVLEETSGLVFFNGRLITHNDSGNSPQLYELDTLSGAITRTVTISNASNVDWEDIAQDDEYLYIGDIGNNNGTRTDLKIYRVSKSEYESSTSVIADVINYSYADQDNFTHNPHNTNWDAESLVVWEDKLFIFSKNWVDNEVNLYVIPKVPGTYSAEIESNYNIQGLLTAATVSSDNVLFLLGYTTSLVPFFIVVSDIDLSENNDIFNNSSYLKYTNVLSYGNQTEGICFVSRSSSEHHLFISCEKETVSGTTFPAKLRTLDFKSDVIGLETESLQESLFSFYPNPFIDRISLNQEVDKISLFTILGKNILSKENCKHIDTKNFPKGVYFIVLENNQKKQTFKAIKN